MKKATAIIICFLIIFGACSCSKNETEAVSGTLNNIPPAGSRKITVLGDSIAAGYGLADQSENYVNIFASNIGAEITNNAVSGYDSSDLLALIKSGQITKDITSSNIIILSIGGNDVLHERALIIEALKDAYFHRGEHFTADVIKIYTDFENNLREIISALRSMNPNASIIIQTVYNPILEQDFRISLINVGKLINRYIDRLNDSITAVCQGLTNVCIFNVAAEMNKDKENFYDAKEDFDIHPTAYGHKSLADIFTRNFNKLVNE